MTINTPAKGGCWRLDEITGDLVADVARPAPDGAAPEVAAPAEAPPTEPADGDNMDIHTNDDEGSL